MRGNSDQVMPLADADAAIRIYKDFNRILLWYDVRHCFTYLHHKEKASGRQVVRLPYRSDPGRWRKGLGHSGLRFSGLIDSPGGLAQLAQHLLGFSDLALDLRQLVI